MTKLSMDLREMGLAGMDWVDLDQDGVQRRALSITVMDLRVP
jgi:hypothetical protein